MILRWSADVWIDADDRQRVVLHLEGGPGETEDAVLVVNGSTWSYRPLAGGGFSGQSDGARVTIPEVIGMFRPQLIETVFRLDLVSPTIWASRQANHYHASRRADAPAIPGMSVPPVGTDSADLIVDTDTGVLLRVSAAARGQEFSVSEVSDIAVDALMADDLFDVSSDQSSSASSGGPRMLELADVARHVPFSLYLPTVVPSGGTPSLLYLAADPSRPAAVWIHYHFTDSRRHYLHLTEMSLADGDSTPPGWEQLERGGLQIALRQPPRNLTAIRVAIGETLVEAESNGSVDELLQAVMSMGPA